MKKQFLFLIFTFFISLFLAKANYQDKYEDKFQFQKVVKSTNVTEMQEWLKAKNTGMEHEFNTYTNAQWNYDSNTDSAKAEKAAAEATLKHGDFVRKLSKEAKDSFDWSEIADENIKRQFQFITAPSESDLQNKSLLTELANLKNEMQKVFSDATIKDACGTEYPLEGRPEETDMTKILADDIDYHKLAWVWKSFRDNSGKKIKNDYVRFIELENIAARAAGKANMADIWKSVYESSSFETDLGALYEELKELYKQLHAYVRFKLKELYRKRLKDDVDKLFPSSGHIPAHLLGNMWAQSWTNLGKHILPGKGLDVTKEMVAQRWTAKRIFKEAENFFSSIGLFNMTSEFWDKSILEKPNRNLICHASAWDFYNKTDFRIKQCTKITMPQLVTAHHEMGHVEYFMAYKDQPVVFRNGANPGFHEAIGDLIALSVTTPSHLHKIGLIKETPETTQSDTINFLLSEALKKLPLIPWTFLIDKWRWDVFKGTTNKDKYNDAWWKLRCEMMGISPPVQRTENDFDPGAKYHIPANVPYVRYFVAQIVQYQFQEALCKIANFNGPLHECDIYENKAAGMKLKAVMEKGSSKKWQTVLKELTGNGTMSASSLVKYFKPLFDWLKSENKKNNITVRWTKACPAVTYEVTTWKPEGECPTPNGAMRNYFSILALCLSFFFLVIKRT